MRVLHVCPLWFPVARDAPGGIETFLSGLVAELDRRGCHSALLASADSSCAGELIPVVDEALYGVMGRGEAWEYVPYEQHELTIALEEAERFDVVHSHVGPGAYGLSTVPGLAGRVLHTQHNPVTIDLEWFVARHPDLPLSAVSEWQARRLREHGARRCAVIPNGVDMDAFAFADTPEEKLLFLGRIEPDKGPDAAARVARRMGLPIALAGPKVRHEFFEAEIEPLLGDGVAYVGVADHARKVELLREAACVVLPFRFDEGFGLVAVEAMACGTPVVATAMGALPEVVDDGVTGYLADDPDRLDELVAGALQLDRAAVRARAHERFDLAGVAARYLELYESLAGPR